MYIKTNKPKKKIFLAIVILLIFLTTINLFIQSTSKNDKNKSNIVEKTIIAGNEISKNKATTVLDKIDWQEDTHPLIGALEIDDDGKSILMTGNWLYQGKNTVYYIPDSHQLQNQTFSFDYNVEFGDSITSAGMLLRVNKVGDTLQGYMLSTHNNGGIIEGEKTAFGGTIDSSCYSQFCWYDECGRKNATIWKFSYPINDNPPYVDEWASGDYSNYIQKTLVKAFDLPGYSGSEDLGDYLISKGNIQITTTAEQIIISSENFSETIDISLDEELGNGFGFFVNTYYHGCNRRGLFTIDNFNVEIEEEDIVSESHNLYVDPNGGTWNDSPEVSTIEGEYGNEVEIPLPIRPGYNFAGWTQTGNSGSMSSLTEDAIYTFGEDAETDDTLTAQWTKIEVEKAYNIDTGEVRRKWRYNRTSKLRNRK